MSDNTKILSNRQLRRRINNAIQNILLPVCTQANDFNCISTNTLNLCLPMCNAVENNENIIVENTVNVTNKSLPALMLTELNSNNIDESYALYTDDSDSSTAEIDENYDDNGLITYTFEINPINFINNLRKLASIII